GAVTAFLVGCGTTPEPTESPPTQTPWIIVVTATPGPESAAKVPPTQTPWIIVATPTRSDKPTVTPPEGATPSPEAATELTATPTSSPPTPTNTPRSEVQKYPAPVLVNPPDAAPISWKATALLEWESVGELAADEYYHVHLDAYRTATGEHWYGDYVFTKGTTHLAEGAFLAPFHLPSDQGRSEVYWWVRVVRKTGENENGKPLGTDISPPSEKRTLMLDPKPEGR
ncbi:MAG: hypothetical protein PVH17_12065, partial [Anaerolineae bacterium]